MPWVNKEMCTGCGICIDECYVKAIAIIENIAFLDEDKCIRCGTCHSVCADNAIRHDGERIPEEVESNLAWVRQFLEHDYYADNKEKQKELVGRMKRYFTKERKVAEKTIELLDTLQKSEYADEVENKNN
jgi:MinD superfamily P-loop ATPase